MRHSRMPEPALAPMLLRKRLRSCKPFSPRRNSSPPPFGTMQLQINQTPMAPGSLASWVISWRSRRNAPSRVPLRNSQASRSRLLPIRRNSRSPWFPFDACQPEAGKRWHEIQDISSDSVACAGITGGADRNGVLEIDIDPVHDSGVTDRVRFEPSQKSDEKTTVTTGVWKGSAATPEASPAAS